MPGRFAAQERGRATPEAAAPHLRRFILIGLYTGTRSQAILGLSLVQLIETSAITGHFCDRSGEAYIDILSCKDFEAELAVSVVRTAFRPKHINSHA